MSSNEKNNGAGALLRVRGGEPAVTGSKAEMWQLPWSADIIPLLYIQYLAMDDE